MKRIINVIFTATLLCSFFNVFGQETEILYLSGRDADTPVDWEFMVTGGRKANVWSTIPVPSNWELQGFGEYNYGHDKNKAGEKGLYRHQFTIPNNWRERRIFIVFEGVMTDTKVKINDQIAGPIHQGGFYRFDYEITGLVNFDKENLLEVTVSKKSSNTSINFAERTSDYWVFGGIYRPVYLKAVPHEYISRTAIDARSDGMVSIDVFLDGIKKSDVVEAQIVQMSGKPLGKTFSQSIKSNAKFTRLTTKITGQDYWTAETPVFYFVDIILKNGNKLVHSVGERFGFRSIEVSEGDGIFLNGERIILKGCNRHSFWPTTGRAISRNRCYQDIMLLKEMNMNAVRMSHYPPDSYFLDLCDEYGIYVLDELAGWQKPPYDTETGKRLVKELVERDVNHPSILFWDNGNEGGWNTDLDGEFEKYDPQQRRVLHPWELFSGIDTDHYESYQSVLNKLNSGNIFMPTEHLHGLYDGGLGAGLDDYWRAMWGNPLNGGTFLWVFADEGVVRTDKNYFIDTDGNHAPDGILGPFHQKEASFYTIKEIWSPVYIESNNFLADNFTGQIPVENRYDFLNLSQCRFMWSLVKYYDPFELVTENKKLADGVFWGPNIPAHQKGFLKVNLPPNWGDADAFILTAYDYKNKELFTWKWKLKKCQKITKRFVRTKGKCPSVKKNRSTYDVFADNFSFSFDKNRGTLKSVRQGFHTIPFDEGPVFVVSDLKKKKKQVKIKTEKIENAQILHVINHPYFEKLDWTIYGSGWLKLNYIFTHQGAVDFMGVSFNYPESQVEEMKWLGKGPYRVWKNRLKGQTIDVWHNIYRNFQVNTAWDYPEFIGYYANFNWVVFKTTDGAITIATVNDNLFMRVYSQQNGENSRHTAMRFPEGDISFLHAIPAMGTKFKPADQLGPQSQKYQASGKYEGTLYFYFGLPGK